MSRTALLAGLFTAALLCGCGHGLRFAITDVANYTTDVDHVRLEGGDFLKVRQGETIMNIPLRTVKTLSLYRDETITVDRQLYFMAEVELATGEIIGTEKTASAKTYVLASGAFVGRMGKSHVRINVSQISHMNAPEKPGQQEQQ
jgi:hypothetical protein